MKIKHKAVFQNGMKSLNWEDLRNSELDKPYFLPHNKEDYLSKVDKVKPSKFVIEIINDLEKSGSKKIFSIGSGIATQEYQIKKFSGLNVVVSDFNESVLRLKKFGVFDNALLLDALKDPLPIDESWAVLLPRIDTEFDDDQLKELFSKFFSMGIKHIYFIPAELLNLRIIVAELKVRLISIIKRKPLVYCGYARNMSCFEKIWSPYYQLLKQHKNDNQIYFLLTKATRI